MKALLHSNLTFLGIYLRQGLLNLTISSNVGKSVSLKLEHDVGSTVVGEIVFVDAFSLEHNEHFLGRVKRLSNLVARGAEFLVPRSKIFRRYCTLQFPKGMVCNVTVKRCRSFPRFARRFRTTRNWTGVWRIN